MQKRSSFTWVLLAGWVLTASLASASSWGWLRQSTVSEFQQADWDMLTATIPEAMTTLADGESTTWLNEQTQNGGTISPLRTFAAASYQCRRTRFQQTAKSGKTGEALFNVCREKDGEWKLMSDSEVKRMRASQP